MSGSIGNARALVGLLQLLQGSYASGQVLVRSTGATGTLPAHSYAVPIVGGEKWEELLVKIEPNPAQADKSWPVTSSGTLVTATTVQGGTRANLAAGTPLRWLPTLTGIEEQSAVGGSAFAGGVFLDTFGSLRQIKLYKDLGGQQKAEEFFRAQVDDFPAAVLNWAGARPADGAGSPNLGPRNARVGAGKILFKNEWQLWLISSRFDGEDLRRLEGDQLRDDVLELLSDRIAYRGVPLSSPQGIEILNADVASITPTSFVDLVTFTTSFKLEKRDTQTFNDWNRTRIELQKTQAGLNPPTLDVPDITVPMP